jgi:hypothetical protein
MQRGKLAWLTALVVACLAAYFVLQCEPALRLTHAEATRGGQLQARDASTAEPDAAQDGVCGCYAAHDCSASLVVQSRCVYSQNR